MSPPGRPKGEYRSAQHEGSPVGAGQPMTPAVPRLSPARPMASRPPKCFSIAADGGFRNSAQRRPAKASTSSASVEPVKSSP